MNRALTKVRAVALAGLERWDELEAELARGAPLDQMRGSSFAFRMRAPAARLAAHRGDVDLVAHHAAVVMDDVEAFGFSFDTPGWICDIAGAALQVGLLEDARRLQRHVVTGADRAQNPWARARGLLLGALVTGRREAEAALAEALALTDECRLEEIWTRRDRPLAGRALARAIAGGIGPDGVAARLAVRCGAEVLDEVVEASRLRAGGRSAAFAALLERAGGIDAETRAKLVGEPAAPAAAPLGSRPAFAGLRCGSWGSAGSWCRRGGEAVPVSAFGRERARALLAALHVQSGAGAPRAAPRLALARPRRRARAAGLSRDPPFAATGDRARDRPAFIRPLDRARRGRGLPARALGRRRDRPRRLPGPRGGRRGRDRIAAEARCADSRPRAHTPAACSPSGRTPTGPSSAGARSIGPTRPCSERLAETFSADRPAPRGAAEVGAARRPRARARGLSPQPDPGLREAGEKALALRQYHACRAVLRRELGVEASPETRALYQLILEDKPLPRREVATAA